MPRKTDKGKSREQVVEECINRLKAVEARKKKKKGWPMIETPPLPAYKKPEKVKWSKRIKDLIRTNALQLRP